jgi:hypothetical protein
MHRIKTESLDTRPGSASFHVAVWGEHTEACVYAYFNFWVPRLTALTKPDQVDTSAPVLPQAPSRNPNKTT